MKIAPSLIPMSLKNFPHVSVTDTGSSSFRSTAKISDEVKHVSAQSARSCKNPGLSLQNTRLLGWLLKHVCLSLLLVHYPLGTQCFARGPRAEEHNSSTWTSVYPSASNFKCFASFISTFSVILPFQQVLQWQHRGQNEAIQLRSFQKGDLNFNWNSCRKKTNLTHSITWYTSALLLVR